MEVSRTSYEDLSDRDDLNERLTDEIRKAFKPFGFKGLQASIESLAKGKSHLLIGTLAATE